MEKTDPENTARMVVDGCSDCDVCRFLMDKELNPENIVTDCLSCRLQFTQLTPHTVIHPIEVLNDSYSAFNG